MENIQKNKVPAYLIPVAILVSLASMAFAPLCLIVPALFASVMVRYQKNRYTAFLIMVAPLIAASIYFSDSDTLIPSLCSAALCILPAVSIAFCQVNRKGGFYTAFYAAGLSILCIYGMICLKSILSGNNAFAEVISVAEESSNELISMLKAYQTQDQAAVMDELVAQLSLVKQMVPTLVMPLICILGCIVGLSNTLFFYLFTSKVRKELNLSKLSAFRFWSVPRAFTTGMIILVLCTFVTYMINSDAAYSVSAVISALFGFPFAVQALSLIDFLIVKKGTNIKVKRILIFALCGLALVLFSSTLVMIGCFEQIFQARKRLSIGNNKKNGPSNKEDMI